MFNYKKINNIYKQKINTLNYFTTVFSQLKETKNHKITKRFQNIYYISNNFVNKTFLKQLFVEVSKFTLKNK